MAYGFLCRVCGSDSTIATCPDESQFEKTGEMWCYPCIWAWQKLQRTPEIFSMSYAIAEYDGNVPCDAADNLLREALLCHG